MLNTHKTASQLSTYNVASLLILLLLICTPTSAQTKETLPAKQLIKNLQQGHHIIYMRHSQTNRDQRDNDKKDFTQCKSQRNLSANGRTLAAAIGDKIERLNIPIGKVFSSPYCRCKDTAELAFGSFSIEEDLQFSMSKKPAELKHLGQRLKSLMLAAPDTKDNTVFVGHTSNLREGLGIWPKPEAVVAVFKKKNNDVVFQGFIKPDDWE